MSTKESTILIFDKFGHYSESLIAELDKNNFANNAIIIDKITDLIKQLNQDNIDFIIIFDTDTSISITDIQSKLPSKNTPPIFVINETYERDAALTQIKHGVQNVYAQSELASLANEIIRYSSISKKNRLIEEQRNNIGLSLQRFQTLINNIPTPVAYAHQGGLVNINPAFADFFHLHQLDTISETSVLDLTGDDDKEKIKSLLNSLEKNEKQSSSVLKNITVIGPNRKQEIVDLTFNKSNLNGEDCIQIILKAKVEPKAPPALIKNNPSQQSFTPEYFIQKLNQAIRQQKKDQKAVLCLIEVADYHRIKKNLGITRAEKVMHQVHDLITSYNSESTLISQASTDVYYLLVKENDKTSCTKTIDTIRNSINQHRFNVEDNSIHMPLNIGMVHLDDNISTPEQAFSLADVACTVARNRSDEEVHVYNPEADRSTVKTLDQNWENSIKDAIENNNFKLVFQPVISLKSPGIPNYEVLLRMKSSTGNDILPNQFLHAAKQSDLEIEIDRWVISNALNTLKATNQHDTSIFVKVSEGSLRSIDFFNWLKSLSAEDKKCMVLEISEELAIQWPSEILNLIQERQSSGFQICIEQFGNHPESENELFELCADYYKIDGAFSNHLATNRKHQSIIHKIALSTKGRNIKTIACFVQDADSLAILWQEGFDYIQGNYLQTPESELDYKFDSLI